MFQSATRMLDEEPLAIFRSPLRKAASLPLIGHPEFEKGHHWPHVVAFQNIYKNPSFFYGFSTGYYGFSTGFRRFRKTWFFPKSQGFTVNDGFSTVNDGFSTVCEFGDPKISKITPKWPFVPSKLCWRTNGFPILDWYKIWAFNGTFPKQFHGCGPQ